MILKTIFPLITFFSAVFCCNPDWFPYGHKCYRGIQFDYDIRLARRYCQIFGGDLAVISDNSTLQNIAAILFENSNEISYWIHENSTISRTTTSSYCSYIYSDESLTAKLGDDGNCDNGKQFICEVEKINSDYICPTSWNYYGNICYKTFKNSATYEQAVSYCALQRSQLTVLDNIAKEHNAAAVIIGQKDVYLVAAKQDGTNENGTFKWSSGNAFQPSCPECITKNDTRGDCMGFSSDQQHPTMFTWIPLNCSSSNNYMCERPPVLASTPQTTPEPTQPTSTLPPLQCPIGYNWKAHEASGFCYWETTYETERLNWYQARQFCQAYGGDLATYDSLHQEEHGLGGAKGHYRGLWFGLQRGKDDIFRWVDNVTRDYENWYRNEPNLSSPTKFCAMHGDKNSRWELDYCGVKRWFVCKAPKIRAPRMPNADYLYKKTPCNFSEPSVHRTEWYLYEDHCYLVLDHAKYSWDTARYFCQDNGGYMASIHSFEETNFILRLISNAPNTNFWIGLSAKGFDSSLTWSDGTPLGFIYWEDNFNNTIDINKCVTFDKQRGSWKTEHCNTFLGVVCKRGMNASYDFTTPEPTPLAPGNCEKGWYRLGNKCYYGVGRRWSQRDTWDNAKKECEKLDATLASIHNSDEQNFLTDIMLNLGTSVWIGLENIDKGTLFKWSDDTSLDFTDWNSNEPAITPEDRGYSPNLTSMRMCVNLDFDVNAMGKWSDTACTREEAYICQKFTNPLLTEPFDDPFMCSNISGWSRLRSTCFGVFEDNPLSWIEAQAICRTTYGANLVTFTSSSEATFLQKRIKNQDSFFWMGIREAKKFKYASLSKQAVPYTNWLAGQPRRRTENDNCVSMNYQTKWIVQNCKEKLPYICALSPPEEEKSIPEGEQTSPEDDKIPCPPFWVNLGNRCYYISGFNVLWSKAVLECRKMGGSLASFHSMDEVTRVVNYLARKGFSKNEKGQITFFNIGLVRVFDGSIGWIDHSPLDFTNYLYDLEDSSNSYDRCGKFDGETGKWQIESCDVQMHRYICAFPKNKGSLNITDSEGNLGANDEARMLERKGDEVSRGLSTGGIVGIIISMLLILSVIGALIYHLYPSRTVRPSLLMESDNL